MKRSNLVIISLVIGIGLSGPASAAPPTKPPSDPEPTITRDAADTSLGEPSVTSSLPF